MTGLRVAGVVSDSIVDGPGVRYAIFTQGCSHNCKGCHNQHTHDYNGGMSVEVDDIISDIKKQKYIKAVTLSGGEPLDQEIAILELVEKLKSDGYHILVFSGYTYEQIMKVERKRKIIEKVDVLIDGKFDINLRSLKLNFRGSSNQRTIDIKETMKSEKIALIDYDKV